MDRINYNILRDNDCSNVFDLELVTSSFLDFRKGSLYNAIASNNVAFYYDFNNYNDINNIYSLLNYSGASSTGFTISDIGLTGIDTGYVSQLTGETLSFTTGSTLFLKPVTGITGTYPLDFARELNLGTQVLDLSGGFYQGFYKLHEFDYEVIPNRTEEGFTLNFWLNRSTTGQSNPSLPSDNFFFFMGSRAENKFYNSFSGETGIMTTTGVLLSSQTGVTTDVSGFGLYYNENLLGFKQIINRQDESGNTSISIFSTGQTFDLDYDNHWLNVTVTFKRDEFLYPCEECGCLQPEPIIVTEYSDNCGCSAPVPDTQTGTLRFFINARPLMSLKIEEPIFRALTCDPSVQEGVPYNISIGGGTQGLFESQTFGGPDPADQNLPMYNNFGGSFIGQIGLAAMYTKPFTIPEIISNFFSLRDTYKIEETFGGPEIIINPGLTNL